MRSLPLLLLFSLAILASCQNPSAGSNSSSDAQLKNLVVSTGTLSPSFAPTTLNYTVAVPNSTTSLSVTGTASDSKAKISSNNGISQSLHEGDNTISLVVTAENASVSKTYKIAVNREVVYNTIYDANSSTLVSDYGSGRIRSDSSSAITTGSDGLTVSRPYAAGSPLGGIDIYPNNSVFSLASKVRITANFLPTSNFFISLFEDLDANDGVSPTGRSLFVHLTGAGVGTGYSSVASGNTTYYRNGILWTSYSGDAALNLTNTSWYTVEILADITSGTGSYKIFLSSDLSHSLLSGALSFPMTTFPSGKCGVNVGSVNTATGTTTTFGIKSLKIEN